MCLIDIHPKALDGRQDRAITNTALSFEDVTESAIAERAGFHRYYVTRKIQMLEPRQNSIIQKVEVSRDGERHSGCKVSMQRGRGLLDSAHE